MQLCLLGWSSVPRLLWRTPIEMPSPSEHKTVQARILAYAQEIGWTLVSRSEAERRRGFDPDATTAEERARRASLYFGELTRCSRPSGSLRLSICRSAGLRPAARRLLHGQLRAFNPLYQEAEGASIGQWQRSPSSIAGNRDFLTVLLNPSKFLLSLFKKANPVSPMRSSAPLSLIPIWPPALVKLLARPVPVLRFKPQSTILSQAVTNYFIV